MEAAGRPQFDKNVRSIRPSVAGCHSRGRMLGGSLPRGPVSKEEPLGGLLGPLGGSLLGDLGVLLGRLGASQRLSWSYLGGLLDRLGP
eukprot:262028-Pyramimonas_sp.AAC.1